MSETIGRYVLDRRIAAGGMGEVHLARQTGPDGFARACVVKTVNTGLAARAEFVEMFLEEARLTAQLNHSHIAQVYDFGKVGAVYFLAMELVDGPALSQVLKHARSSGSYVPIGVALRMVSQAAQALDYLHRKCGPDGLPAGMIHRDISPGNILLSKEGLVKVIDFGIAKANQSTRRTQVGMVRGKLAYVSPEQLLGERLDGRTDLYSLGLVLYELLTNRRAVPGKNESEVIQSLAHHQLIPVPSIRADCPAKVLEVLARATARERGARYSTAAEFSDGLEEAISLERMVVNQSRLARLAALVASADSRLGQAPAPPETPSQPPAAGVAPPGRNEEPTLLEPAPVGFAATAPAPPLLPAEPLSVAAQWLKAPDELPNAAPKRPVSRRWSRLAWAGGVTAGAVALALGWAALDRRPAPSVVPAAAPEPPAPVVALPVPSSPASAPVVAVDAGLATQVRPKPPTRK